MTNDLGTFNGMKVYRKGFGLSLHIHQLCSIGQNLLHELAFGYHISLVK